MSVVKLLSAGPVPIIDGGCWLPRAPGRGTLGVLPYLRTPVLNLDTDIVYVYVTVDGVARRAWVVPPTATPTGAEPVSVCLENVARNLGCPGAGSPLQGTVGTPWAGTGLTAFVPLDAPLQILFPATPVGAAVVGAYPTPGHVASVPVPLTWTEMPAAFPPPIPASAGALRLTTLTCSPTDGRVYTGVPYGVYDNSVQRNPVVALPVPGQPDVFQLAVCPAGLASAGGPPDFFNVTLCLVWPDCSVPPARVQLPPAMPARAAVLDPCAVRVPVKPLKSCFTCPDYWTTT